MGAGGGGATIVQGGYRIPVDTPSSGYDSQLTHETPPSSSSGYDSQLTRAGTIVGTSGSVAETTFDAAGAGTGTEAHQQQRSLKLKTGTGGGHVTESADC